MYTKFIMPPKNTWEAYLQLHLGDPALNRENTVRAAIWHLVIENPSLLINENGKSSRFDFTIWLSKRSLLPNKS